MKFYILIISISIQIYKSQLCESIKTCYNCFVSKYNCYWDNNICRKINLNESYKNNNTKSFISYPFITKQYNCINNEKDIEFFEELDDKNISISLDSKKDKNEKIKYHIYCFKYLLKQSILIKINYNEEYKNNILEISLYDKITNSDKVINIENNTYNNINIQSNYFCLKITYKSNKKDVYNLLSFNIINYNKEIITGKIPNKNSSFIILFILLFLTIFAITMFIFCHKKNSNEINKIIITKKSKQKQRKKNISLSNTNKNNETKSEDNEKNDSNICDISNSSNCSELQEKYFQLSKDNFVDNNYETIDSFVNNLHNKEKKNIFLKAIIKTFPSFNINRNSSEFIGIFCTFCESKIKLNEKICFINCGHIFHYDCIYQQIITNEEYKCIICKENITI